MKKYTRKEAAAELYAAQKAQEGTSSLSYATVYRRIYTADGGCTWRLRSGDHTSHYNYTL